MPPTATATSSAPPTTVAGAANDATPPVPAAELAQVASLSLTPAIATTTLTAGAALLVLAHLAVVGIGAGSGIDDATGLGRLLHLDGERNAPALFSTALFLLAALAFALWARAGIGARPGRRMWWLLAVLFVFLAIDEYFSLHERLSAPMRALFDLHGTVLHYAWIVPYGFGVAALTVLFLPVYLRLPRAIQLRFALAAALFLAGVFGMQLVGAVILAVHGDDSARYAIAAVVEEALEMAGLVLLIDTLLHRLAALPQGACVQLAPARR